MKRPDRNDRPAWRRLASGQGETCGASNYALPHVVQLADVGGVESWKKAVMTDEQKKAAELVRLTRQSIRTPDDPRATYVNVCNVLVSPEELFLHFGQQSAENLEEAAHVMRVCMSLPHAKRLLRALANTIQVYENTFGPVVADVEDRLTPEAREQLGLDKAGSADAPK
jgi:Protein of unknown function (DUF3467)